MSPIYFHLSSRHTHSRYDAFINDVALKAQDRADKLKLEEFSPPAPSANWKEQMRDTFKRFKIAEVLKNICHGMQQAFYEIKDTVDSPKRGFKDPDFIKLML